MLYCPALVIARVGDRGNDGGLPIGPAVHGNSRAFANGGTGSVRGDQKARRNRLAVCECNLEAIGRCPAGKLPALASTWRKINIGHRGLEQNDAFGARPLEERADQRGGLPTVVDSVP